MLFFYSHKIYFSNLYIKCLYTQHCIMMTILKTRLDFELLHVWSNLQVYVKNLLTKQAPNEVEVRGPPVSKAFDGQGYPTKVLLAVCFAGISVIKTMTFFPSSLVLYDYLSLHNCIHASLVIVLFGCFLISALLICCYQTLDLNLPFNVFPVTSCWDAIFLSFVA